MINEKILEYLMLSKILNQEELLKNIKEDALHDMMQRKKSLEDEFIYEYEKYY